MKNHSLKLISLITAFGSVLGAAADQPLPTVKDAPCKEALEAKIAQAKKTVERYQTGHVVVGRVVLDGSGDPRDVIAQMEILPGGYFAGETKDLRRPISFRMHQYAPLDVELKGLSGDMVDIGTIHMRQLPTEELASLKGRIELEGCDSAAAASVTLSVARGPVNTPHNGSAPRKHWPSPIKADSRSDGTVTASGFSPMEYYCTVTAPGYVKQSFPVTFKPGKVFDLGTIKLERPIQIALSYVVSEKPPFDLSQQKKTVVSGGERWKATPDIKGWDLEFKQDGDRIVFDYSYGPCTFQDLGPGTLEEMIPFANRASADGNPRGRTVENSFTYIIHQQFYKRWILLKVELMEKQ
jgi:hypothetical protein